LIGATTATATVFSTAIFASTFTTIFPFMAAASGVATTAAAFVLSGGRVRFILMANAITGRQCDLKLVKLVPLFLGALVIGNRQQRLQAAARRGCVLFSHGRHYPICGVGGT
jgi:hypothetical protein